MWKIRFMSPTWVRKCVFVHACRNKARQCFCDPTTPRRQIDVTFSAPPKIIEWIQLANRFVLRHISLDQGTKRTIVGTSGDRGCSHQCRAVPDSPWSRCCEKPASTVGKRERTVVGSNQYQTNISHNSIRPPHQMTSHDRALPLERKHTVRCFLAHWLCSPTLGRTVS